jgi:lipoyl-dependent peroxiredoxin
LRAKDLSASSNFRIRTNDRMISMFTAITMALAFALQMAGFNPTELASEAAVTLEPDGPQRFKISRSALTLRAQVPGISADKFASIAREAELNCPVSKVLKAEITLDAKLG